VTTVRLIDVIKIHQGPGEVLDLVDNPGDAKGCQKFWSLLLWLAVKDRATEVRYEQTSGEWTLRYRIHTKLHPLVPPPDLISRELVAGFRQMVDPAESYSGTISLLRRRPKTTTGRTTDVAFVLKIDEALVGAWASIDESANSPSLVVRLFPGEEAAQRAHEIGPYLMELNRHPLFDAGLDAADEDRPEAGSTTNGTAKL
jgi:hypothetical protein